MNSHDGSFQHSGFFVARSPLLPIEELLGLSSGLRAAKAWRCGTLSADVVASDISLLRKRLHAIVRRAEIREALFVASPDLDTAINKWTNASSSECGNRQVASRIELTLMKYFLRMLGRPTPFGLFAGISVGTFGDATILELQSRDSYERKGRFDSELLHSLVESVLENSNLKMQLLYVPNSTLYQAIGRLRYAESRFHNGTRSYHLVEADNSIYLGGVLERARGGATAADLGAVLESIGVSRSDGEAFVEELIDNQILVPTILPNITGGSPVRRMIDDLQVCSGAEELVAQLKQTETLLGQSDKAPLGSAIEEYSAICREWQRLPAANLNRIIQVDLAKPAHSLKIGQEVFEEVMKGVEILRIVTPNAKDNLKPFRDSFKDRYGDREVPLVDALDDELGVGLEGPFAPETEYCPLIEDLSFPASQDEPQSVLWGKRETFLYQRIGECLAERQIELVLDKEDIEALRFDSAKPLPDAFSVAISLATASKQEVIGKNFRILLEGIMGPSGVRLLGRFCHLDDRLRYCVEEHIRAEEALAPDCIFAEIAHCPPGRLGNVALRPVLRKYEIPYLGVSGAPAEHQIAITDLAIRVAGDRIQLRSMRLGREVIPRLSCAHDYFTSQALDLYRFLCMLQDQSARGLIGWSWGVFLNLGFLPRVVSGKVVFTKARWCLRREQITRLSGGNTEQRFEKLQRLRIKQRIPRFVMYVEGESELAFDLDNILCVQALIELIRRRNTAVLVEMFPPPDKLPMRSPEGRFVSEFIIPIAKSKPMVAETFHKTSPIRPVDTPRSFMPGSEWLQANVYTGKVIADRVLQELMEALSGQLLDGTIDKWFFLRYVDPHWHLRIRLHGEPRALAERVLPLIYAKCERLLRSGRIWRLSLQTYEREVERYGGLEGIKLAEELFYFDSAAVLTIIQMLTNDRSEELRWYVCLKSMDTFLADFGLDLDAKEIFAEKMRDYYAIEFNSDAQFRRQLGDKYRQIRARLETLLSTEEPPETDVYVKSLHALQERSDLVIHAVRALPELTRERLLGRDFQFLSSVVHMHVNRILRSSQRRQEYILYEFLTRVYAARRARA